ncbi:MAG: dihydrolipoamide acetyltransferase family protein [Phycisphaerales bacterium]
MSISVTMPRLSDTMEQGTVVRWHVKEGSRVSSGDVIADIETDKATMEMQAFDDGVVARLLIPEGKQVKVGEAIAVIAVDGEDPGSVSAAPTARAAASSAASTAAPAAAPASSNGRGPAIVADVAAVDHASRAHSAAADSAGMKVSPVARRMAQEMGVDLGQVRGSGPGGRVIKRDIQLAAENKSSQAPSRAQELVAAAPVAAQPAAAPAASVATALVHGAQAVEVPVTSMRQTIARRLVESKSSIPHYQVTMRFSMDAILEMRKELNTQLAGLDVKLSVNDFIVRACALAMSQNPYFNASWAGDRILIHQQVNIGVAIALDEEKGGGLVVGVVRDADRKSLRQISQEVKALGEKARTRGLSMEDMSGATFTISNLGMFGVDNFTAIINPPNSAILACGAAIEQPVVRDHQLVVGWEMNATLSLDHRVIDGAMAARYLQTLKQAIETPTILLV